MCALLDTPRNTRVFEQCEGVGTVTALFKGGAGQLGGGGGQVMQELRLKVVEFFYFYLMPETATRSTDWQQQRTGQGIKGALLEIAATPGDNDKSGGGLPSNRIIFNSSISSATTAPGDVHNHPASSSQGKAGNHRGSMVRTTTDKQAILSKYLGHLEVEGLVQDLQESLAGSAGGVPVA